MIKLCILNFYINFVVCFDLIKAISQKSDLQINTKESIRELSHPCAENCFG
jgi:hypothetical protein